MMTRWPAFLLLIALLAIVGWLLLTRCAPPLCWFLLSLAVATLLVMLIACMTSLANCVCTKRVG